MSALVKSKLRVSPELKAKVEWLAHKNNMSIARFLETGITSRLADLESGRLSEHELLSYRKAFEYLPF